MAAPPGAPVVVRDWFDVYEVEPAAVVICPDCEQRSPELNNVYALARWTVQHQAECQA
jgi:hypothetical protein